MKTMRDAQEWLTATSIFLLTMSELGGAVLSGPVMNANNGHVYYLLSENTWTASEAEAEALGGTLAIIDDQAENDWIYSTFAMYGGIPRNLWIGATDAVVEGTWVWVTGEPWSYMAWATGEPNDSGDCLWFWYATLAGWDDTDCASQNAYLCERAP
jgi:hypothetical protein